MAAATLGCSVTCVTMGMPSAHVSAMQHAASKRGVDPSRFKVCQTSLPEFAEAHLDPAGLSKANVHHQSILSKANVHHQSILKEGDQAPSDVLHLHLNQPPLGYNVLLMDVVEGGGQLRQGVIQDIRLAWESLLLPAAKAPVHVHVHVHVHVTPQRATLIMDHNSNPNLNPNLGPPAKSNCDSGSDRLPIYYSSEWCG